MLAESGRWNCTLCKRSSKRWALLAAGLCEGSAARRLATRVKAITDSGGGLGTGHCFWLSGEVLWCSTCGAFAEGCGTMALARPCQGKRKVGSRQSANQGGRNGLRQQLRNLVKGLHPRTRALLPPPIPMDPNAVTPQAFLDSYSSQSGRRYELATASTISPTLLPLLERVRKREADNLARQLAPVAKKRRISVKSAPCLLSTNSLLRTSAASQPGH